MKLFKSVLILAALVMPSYGAVAGAVTVSTTSRSSNVVTVTCTSTCNIAANQGFVLTGVTDSSFNTNGTAVTGSGTTFTFNQSGSNGTSTGGSVTPAKQVIVLTVNSFTQTNVIPPVTGITVNGVYWVTTVFGVAGAGKSIYTGATTAENNSLASGTTIEIPFSVQYGSTESKAQIQSDLGTRYATLQAAQSASGVQPGQFYGGYFDGSGWSF